MVEEDVDLAVVVEKDVEEEDVVEADVVDNFTMF